MSKCAVLLIEDEEMVIDVACMMLKRLGCEVAVAKTGAEAISTIQKQADAFDFLIVDFNLPDMTAVECLTELRNYSSTPAILSSGSGNQLNKNENESLNIVASLNKPFSLNQLDELINKITQ